MVMRPVGEYPTIRARLPNFCWQIAHEILTMIEQVDEDVNSQSIHITLHQMAALGELEAKNSGYRDRNGRRNVNVFRRKPA